MSSAFCFPLPRPAPACWLYPLKPGGKQKADDVWQKMYTLIYPDPNLINAIPIICCYNEDN